MFYMNDRMKKIIPDETDCELDEEVSAFINDIIRYTREVKDCVIYDDEGIDESEIDPPSLFRLVGNLTGYEMGCNEFRLERSKFKAAQFQTTANVMNDMLKSKFKNRDFVVYIFVDEEFVQIRFHTYRAAEGLWVSSDLNSCTNPVLYRK